RAPLARFGGDGSVLAAPDLPQHTAVLAQKKVNLSADAPGTCRPFAVILPSAHEGSWAGRGNVLTGDDEKAEGRRAHRAQPFMLMRRVKCTSVSGCIRRPSIFTLPPSRSLTSAWPCSSCSTGTPYARLISERFVMRSEVVVMVSERPGSRPS